jgi:hypothetical protein
MSESTARAEGRESSPSHTFERRATVRYPSSLLSSLHTVAPNKEGSWSAEIRDVSAGGIGLLLRRRFERGTLLAVEPIEPGPDAPTLLLVQVVRSTAQAEGRWLLGCQLVRELSASEVRALR